MKLEVIILLLRALIDFGKRLYNKPSADSTADFRSSVKGGDQRGAETKIFSSAGEPTNMGYPGLSKRKAKKR